jgi:hypothetical protein
MILDKIFNFNLNIKLYKLIYMYFTVFDRIFILLNTNINYNNLLQEKKTIKLNLTTVP